MIVPVILSGGSGTRVWPLSRKALPKQFIALYGDDSLFVNTLARTKSLPHVTPPVILGNQEHRFIIAEELRSAGVLQGSSIILEPVARNTAPAIAVAAQKAVETNKDAVILVLPADHVILDEEAFSNALLTAYEEASKGSLVAFGIVPESPHTGYGYVKGSAKGVVSSIASFVEKPTLEVAKQYVTSGDYYWNSGMFMLHASTYLEELARLQPDIESAATKALRASQNDLEFIRLDAELFQQSPSLSIDYAVMEHTDKGVVVPVECGWSDIGSWESLWEIQDKDQDDNVCLGDIVTHDVKGSYLHSTSRLVAAIGLDNHVIVETDDAVLVAEKSRVQEVKEIVAQLKNQNRKEPELHTKAYRPWGSYETLVLEDRFQVKRIIVSPGGRLSLQKHCHRAEHWVVVSGTAEVRKGDEVMTLAEDQSTYISLGQVHQLYNPGKIPLVLIEVQTGSYLGEDDIVRLEDCYGRE